MGRGLFSTTGLKKRCTLITGEVRRGRLMADIGKVAITPLKDCSLVRNNGHIHPHPNPHPRIFPRVATMTNSNFEHGLQHAARLAKLSALIKQGGLTKPALAQALRVHKRTIDGDIAYLKSLGAPLKADGRRGWRYECEWDLRSALTKRLDEFLKT